jgi:hypothetical protein
LITKSWSRRTTYPGGWKHVQDGGTYRLERRDDAARFGYAVGPHSWKKFLFPFRLMLWRDQKNAGGGFDLAASAVEPPRYAFIGVRSCVLHAFAIQDQVFTAGACTDPYYKSVRDTMLVVALNCGQAAGNCFSQVMASWLEATSLQLMDLYGVHNQGAAMTGAPPDPMLPVLCRVAQVRRETRDKWTLDVMPQDGSAPLLAIPGQFNMIYAFGTGEVPISIRALPAAAPRSDSFRAGGIATRCGTWAR